MIAPSSLLMIGLAIPVALLGLGFGWQAYRRVLGRQGRRGQWEPVGGLSAPSDLPWAAEWQGQGRIWRVPDARWRLDLLCALARASAPQGPVLLVLRPGSRAHVAETLAGIPGISETNGAFPAPSEVLDAARSLDQGLPPVVLVEGPESLGDTAPGEEPEAMAELLAERPRELTILILMTGDEAGAVDQTLVEAGDGLAWEPNGPRHTVREGRFED